MKKYLIILVLFNTLNYAYAETKKLPFLQGSNFIAPKEKLEKLTLQSEKVPKNFQSQDIVELYEKLEEKFPFTKGEFETTDDFNNKFTNENIGNDIYVSSIDNIGSNLKYSADHEYFTYKPFHEIKDSNKISIFSKLIEGKPSEGQNAYGAKAIISNKFFKSYNLDLGKSLDIASEIIFGVPRDIAKNIKPLISAVIFYKLRINERAAASYYETGNRLIYKSHFVTKPTITEPEHITYLSQYIYAEGIEIWIYNKDTGEIIRKRKN